MVVGAACAGLGMILIATAQGTPALVAAVACELCGGGDLWIKTCVTPEGSRLLVCDPCHAEHAAELTVVPGRLVVTARCDLCGVYGNPRGFVRVRLGGRKGAYSGTCLGCAGERP